MVRKNPRLAATAVANALTVATPAIFMGGGAPNGRMDQFYEYANRNVQSPMSIGIGLKIEHFPRSQAAKVHSFFRECCKDDRN
jgi:hypothetical protein